MLAAVSVIVMPLLVRAKRKVARSINSNALMADSKQTELCTYLSASLLAGLVLNALLGWWWADPVAALVMVPIIVGEESKHCEVRLASISDREIESWTTELSYSYRNRRHRRGFVNDYSPQTHVELDRMQGWFHNQAFRLEIDGAPPNDDSGS